MDFGELGLPSYCDSFICWEFLDFHLSTNFEIQLLGILGVWVVNFAVGEVFKLNFGRFGLLNFEACF